MPGLGGGDSTSTPVKGLNGPTSPVTGKAGGKGSGKKAAKGEKTTPSKKKKEAAAAAAAAQTGAVVNGTNGTGSSDESRQVTRDENVLGFFLNIIII